MGRRRDTTLNALPTGHGLTNHVPHVVPRTSMPPPTRSSQAQTHPPHLVQGTHLTGGEFLLGVEGAERATCDLA